MTCLCPTCHQPVTERIPVLSLSDAPLPKAERKIVEILGRAYPRSLDKRVLIDLLYEDDPDGGPDDPSNVLTTLVCRLRSKLPSYGWTIPKNTKAGTGIYGRYRLEPVQQ